MTQTVNLLRQSPLKSFQFFNYPCLQEFLSFVEVFDAELSVGCAAIVVFYDTVAYIHRITRLDVVEVVSHIESYS